MAKKKTAAKSTELDAKEFFAAINDIEKERGIPKTYMIEKITQALVAAYKRDHEGITDNVTVDADEEKGEVRMYVKKDVVETVDNPHTEMSLEDARKALPRAQLGDVLRIEIKPKNFGRIAAQTARQVIIQGMREAERGMVFDEFSAKEHEILTGSVTRVDERTGSVSIRLTSGGEFTDAYLLTGGQDAWRARISKRPTGRWRLSVKNIILHLFSAFPWTQIRYLRLQDQMWLFRYKWVTYSTFIRYRFAMRKNSGKLFRAV